VLVVLLIFGKISTCIKPLALTRQQPIAQEPSMPQSLSASHETMHEQGALMGALLYGTVDFTNAALLVGWDRTLAVIDVAWGTVACAGLAALQQRGAALLQPRWKHAVAALCITATAWTNKTCSGGTLYHS
jgi:Predicted membrane protein (DUF2177)